MAMWWSSDHKLHDPLIFDRERHQVGVPDWRAKNKKKQAKRWEELQDDREHVSTILLPCKLKSFLRALIRIHLCCSHSSVESLLFSSSLMHSRCFSLITIYWDPSVKDVWIMRSLLKSCIGILILMEKPLSLSNGQSNKKWLKQVSILAFFERYLSIIYQYIRTELNLIFLYQQVEWQNSSSSSSLDRNLFCLVFPLCPHIRKPNGWPFPWRKYNCMLPPVGWTVCYPVQNTLLSYNPVYGFLNQSASRGDSLGLERQLFGPLKSLSIQKPSVQHFGCYKVSFPSSSLFNSSTIWGKDFWIPSWPQSSKLLWIMHWE